MAQTFAFSAASSALAAAIGELAASAMTRSALTAAYDDDGAVVIALDVTATGVGSGAPIDQTYWLGARVQADKIIFFGFFRTESDAMDAVT